MKYLSKSIELEPPEFHASWTPQRIDKDNFSIVGCKQEKVISLFFGETLSDTFNGCEFQIVCFKEVNLKQVIIVTKQVDGMAVIPDKILEPARQFKISKRHSEIVFNVIGKLPEKA